MQTTGQFVEHSATLYAPPVPGFQVTGFSPRELRRHHLAFGGFHRGVSLPSFAFLSGDFFVEVFGRGAGGGGPKATMRVGEPALGTWKSVMPKPLSFVPW